MRFAVALLTLIAAAALVLAGVAQRTVLRPADGVHVTASVPSGVQYVVVPSAVLRAHPGQQRLHLEGSGTAFAAYGRSADVTGWLAGQRYAELRVGTDGALLAPVVRTAPAVAGFTGTAGADPDGSDLWLDQRTARASLDWTVSTPASVSMLIASDGRAAAPGTIRLTWPTRTATPTAVPLIVAGAVLLVVGLLLYIWALVHVRRRRGPRRKPPAKLPKPPTPPRYRSAPTAPPATASKGRRSVRTGAMRMVPVLGIALVAALGLSVAGPVRPAVAAKDPGAAVTEDQARRIVLKVSAVAEQADAKLDGDLAATRFAGPALELRRAAYRIKAKSRKAALPQAIPGADAAMRLILPEATSTWPRTLFVVLADRAHTTVPPVALALVQDDPRADYRVHYSMSLQPSAKLPDLPSALLGGSRLNALTTVLKVPPAVLGTDYGVLLRDTSATEATVFDSTDDRLAKGVGVTAKKKAARQLGSTARITFADEPIDPASVIAMSTANAGALVAVDLKEDWTVKPKRAGVTVKPPASVRALAKTSSSSKGIRSVYGYQLLFAVPSAGSTKPVTLLGYAQGLVSAKEL